MRTVAANATTGPGPALSGPERGLITRTWRRIAVQTAALFAAGVIALGSLAVGIVLNIADRTAQRQLTQATDDPDAITNPPIGVLVYESTDGRLRSSPGAPGAPVDPAAMAATTANGPTGDAVVRRDGRDYRVRTVRHGSTTTQVALDLTDQQTERMRLLMGTAAAGAVGLVGAGGVGALIARRAIAPLGHALARQRRFIADASHELRTPLTQLHTRAQLLEMQLRSSADPGQVREDVEHLVRHSRQLGEVLEELLLAAQLQAEPQRHGPVDLVDLADQAVEAERPRARERGVELRLDELTGGPYLVRGTEAALRRVFASLVDNAVSHTGSGGRITIELRADDRTVEIRVADTGDGFEPREAGRLFERFYRGGHGDGRRFGLGLSLVREVVVAHGGTVTAVGAPGAGACFVVVLPAWRTRGGETADRTR